MIASDVFINALSPNSQGTNKVTGIIEKNNAHDQITTVKQFSKKTREEMVNTEALPCSFVRCVH